MLIRRSAGVLATALLLGLAPPLTGESRAGGPGRAARIARGFLAAERMNRGSSVRVALLSDGVATNVKPLKHSLEKEKDLVRTPRPKRITGTLMASVIAGAVPKATILPVRVYAALDDPGGRDWQQTADWGGHIAGGIRYAVDHGADVIAVDPYSGQDEATTGLRTAVAYAQAKNVVVVAPIGVRKSGDLAPYPVSAPGVIGVGAVTATGRRDRRSTSRSDSAFISAPGTALPSIGPDNQLWTFRGSLVALTFVTTAVAMVRSAYPRLTPAQVGQALSTSARRPAGTGRYDTELGFGYLNTAGALDRARALARRPVPALTAHSSVPDKTAFDGDRPGAVRARPYDPVRLGGFGALAYAGLVALGFAAWLMFRRRPAPPPASVEPPPQVSAAKA